MRMTITAGTVATSPDAGGATSERAPVVALKIVLVLLVLALTVSAPLTSFYVRAQDLPVAALCAGLLIFFLRDRLPRVGRPTVAALGDRRMVWTVAVMVAVLSWLAGRLLLLDVALSRDEQMVLFDASVFLRGEWAAATPEAWQPLAGAMNDMFLVPLGGVARVSAYLPGNAMLHAVSTATLGSHAWWNPVMAGVGILATASVAHRATGGDRLVVGAAIILVATSMQVIATSGTVYAMPSHLAFNMLWLALVLRGGALCHGLAVMVAAIACGLHQVVFHPFFAGPFVLWLLIAGRWRWGLFHAGAYALIGLFWLAWPGLQSEAVLGADALAQAAAPPGLIERALALLDTASLSALPLMSANLLRYVAWQNLAFLPLFVAGCLLLWRRREPFGLALGLCLLATPLLMAILLPYQGHGWGYRYLHGLIGIGALVGGLGLRSMADACPDRARSLVVAGTALTVLVAWPWQGWHLHRTATPHATAHQALAASSADVVLVNPLGAPFSVDLVINDAALSAPVRLIEPLVNAEELDRLCREGMVARLAPQHYSQIAAIYGVEARISADLTPDPCS